MTACGPGALALASPVIRQALVPMAVFYLLLMAALGLGLLRVRRRGTGRASEPPGRIGARPPGQVAAPGAPRGWAQFSRHVAGTVIGGYLLLMAVVTVYYYGIARVGGAFLYSAVTGTALLIGLTMPVFAAIAWISARRHGRPGQ